jgi:Glycine cleavage system T protein (aminomethyltransferase)
VRENYSRRFRITFPNEELAAARPLHTTPIYDRLLDHNAVMGAGFGLEHPLWFQDKDKEPIEDVTFYRSNAFKNVGEESRAVRERVGFSEASNFAKYKVSGAGSAAWLQSLFTNALPKIGRTVLTAMLNPEGKIVGEFSISRIGEEDSFCSDLKPPKFTIRAGSWHTCRRTRRFASKPWRSHWSVSLLQVRDRVMFCKNSPALRWRQKIFLS